MFVFTAQPIGPAEAIKGLLEQAWAAMVASREARADGRTAEAYLHRATADDLHAQVDKLVKAREAREAR